MARNIIFWIFALIITAALAYYQKITGPTYPLKGSVIFQGDQIDYQLPRSFLTSEDAAVDIKTARESIEGEIIWKRYKTKDEWTRVKMVNQGGELNGLLSVQPAAGKIIYKVILKLNDRQISIPEEKEVVARFRNGVPFWLLIPHIFIMFCVMLLSARALLECLNPAPKFKNYAFWTIGLLIIGGFILGSLAQQYASGQYWTGLPIGFDLTQSKTLIAFIGWIAALYGIYKSDRPKRWVAAAAILLILVYMIPHSLFGS